MMTVYRVETAEGFGPYSEIAPEIRTDYSVHPEPDLEGLEFDSSMSFGFESLERLMDWFSAEEIETLGVYGEHWLVSKYEAQAITVQSSKTQSVFDRERATLFGCFPLDRLRSYSREEISTELSFELDLLFEPHAECVPAEQHESLSEHHSAEFTPRLPESTYGDQRTRIREMLSNLTDGCYYEINWKLHVYRDRKLYLLGSDALLEVSLEGLKDTAKVISPVRKS